MIYAIARKISTQECYNNEYKVVSLYNEWYLDDALEQAMLAAQELEIVVEAINLSIASGVATETTKNTRIGDSINSNGDAWQSGG